MALFTTHTVPWSIRHRTGYGSQCLLGHSVLITASYSAAGTLCYFVDSLQEPALRLFFLFTIGFSAHPSFTPPPKFVVSSHPPSPCGFVVQRERCKIAPLEHLVLTVEEGGFLPRQRQWQRAAPLKRYGYMLHLPAKIVESSLGIIQSTA